MYVKLINETTIDGLDPNYVIIDGIVYTNPIHNPNLNIDELGYKELIVDDMPQYDDENQTADMYYQVKSNKIHRSWRVRNLTAQEIAERERFREMMEQSK